MTTSQTLVFVGTYTENMGFVDGKADGVSVYELDLESGALNLVSQLNAQANPSYIAIHPNKKLFYLANETENGQATACEFDVSNGTWTVLNQQPTQGNHPCHISMDASGEFVFASNYTSGSLTVFPIGEDGQLQPASAHIQHTGQSINPARQEAPHAHCAITDSQTNRLFVADLGIDKVMVYQLNRTNGQLSEHSSANVKAGAGVRHLTLHPTRQWLFAINELDSTITTFAYDKESGQLTIKQTLSTLPSNFHGESTCAAIRVHPSGNFVYGSNRGHDSIALFSVDKQGGELKAIGHQSTQGKTPRDFNIDPSGNWMLVANQDTNTIVTFRIDTQTGELHPTEHILDTPTPVCIQMAVYG